MRRSNLLWFAMGAGTASSVVLASHFLIKGEPPVEPKQAYLLVYDRGFAIDELDQANEIASTSARMLHNCNVKQFEIEWARGADSLTRSLIPLTQANEASFDCVLEASRLEKFDHRIIMKANNAQKN